MLPASVRIWVCTQPQDMRCSFDRLAELTRTVLGKAPEDGGLYVFVGKRPTRVKVLWWDENGFCLLYKRLHQAIFVLPKAGEDAVGIQIDGEALGLLLAGVAREKNRKTYLH